MLAVVIRHWSVKNFKSIGYADLSLAPLTLFAGANSSGKSTLLQSILLIAQTLAARGTTQTVVLNGYIVKLGQFDDLRNDRSAENRVHISWTLTPEIVEDRAMLRLRRAQSILDAVSCNVVIGLSDERQASEQLNPLLQEFCLTCELRKSPEQEAGESFVRLTRKRARRAEEELAVAKRARAAVNLDFVVELDEESLDYLRDEYADALPIGCFLQAFMPGSLVVKFDERREIAKTILGILSGPGRSRYSRMVPPARPVIPESLFQEIRRRLSLPEPLFPSAEAGRSVTLQELAELRQGRQRSTIQPEVLSDIESLVLAGLPPMHEIIPAPLPGRSLDDAVDFTRDFFARQIRYLGPLREEPKALYPLQHSADPQDVGLHGEHTAAVLHRFRGSEVQYVPTSYFDENGAEPETKVVTLEEAVFDWLRYLDVAASVDTSDEGKFGYGLKVVVEGGLSPHDLTHVGVGVSQVLPIVVMCILANRDTTIVLEQPELHLNPKVQTRLADFFLSLAMIKKQCLIETHSEYLINRLRLRAARGSGSSVSDLMKLYFVEKVDGLTTYRDVIINEFGSLTSWPKNFIDQSQREIEDILIAASEKMTSAQ